SVATGLALALVASLLLLVAGPAKPAAAASSAARQACPADRPDLGAALMTARLCGGPVGGASMTTETATFAVRPDGSGTVGDHWATVRVADGHGGWVPVDLTLRVRPDGSVAPAVHPSGLVLSGGAAAGSNDLASLTVAGQRVTLGWLGALPAPVLSGTT